MRPGYRKCELDSNFSFFIAELGSSSTPTEVSWILCWPACSSRTGWHKVSQHHQKEIKLSVFFFNYVEHALYRLHRDPGPGLGVLLLSPSAQCVASQSTLSTRNGPFHLYHCFYKYVQQVSLFSCSSPWPFVFFSSSCPGVCRRSQAVPQKLHQLPDQRMS